MSRLPKVTFVEQTKTSLVWCIQSVALIIYFWYHVHFHQNRVLTRFVYNSRQLFGIINKYFSHKQTRNWILVLNQLNFEGDEDDFKQIYKGVKWALVEKLTNIRTVLFQLWIHSYIIISFEVKKNCWKEYKVNGNL